MALTRWTGALGDGDWNQVGNWNSTVPGSADVVLFPKDGVTSAPSVNMTHDTIGFDQVIVERGTTYAIGTSGNPLATVVSYLLHEGTGTFYFNYQDASAYAGAERGHIVVRSPNQSLAAVIAGDDAIAQVDIIEGNVTVNNTNGVARLFVRPDNLPSQARVTIPSTSLVIETVNDGGIVTIESGANPTEVHMISGKIVNSSAALASSNFILGGTWDQRVVDITGIGTSLFLLGGTLDTTNVVGAVLGDLYIGSRATILRGAGASFVNEYEIGGTDLI